DFHFDYIDGSSEQILGDFKEDKFEGEGIYAWPDGQQYTGQFIADEKTGKGIMSWPDGRRYEMKR
ncbi:unnamed protein product, partial [Rotaria socialis]